MKGVDVKVVVRIIYNIMVNKEWYNFIIYILRMYKKCIGQKMVWSLDNYMSSWWILDLNFTNT